MNNNEGVTMINTNNLPVFGDICVIEQHRYGAPNEFYGYKILETKRSNSWVEVPVKGNGEAVLHDHLDDVVSCVPNSIGDYMPMNFRVKDLKSITTAKSRDPSFNLLNEIMAMAELERFNGNPNDAFDRGWRGAFAHILRHITNADQHKGCSFFSHDFNGDGFQYHPTLDEAKKAAENDLDIYRERVANGQHVADMGEFNELCYGIVLGSAGYSVEHVVTQKDVDEGEYNYPVGTEILSLSFGVASNE